VNKLLKHFDFGFYRPPFLIFPDEASSSFYEIEMDFLAID